MSKDNITEVTIEVPPLTITKDELAFIDKLNEQVNDTTKGYWLYVEGVGTVYKPTLSAMPNSLPSAPTESPSPLIEELAKWGKQIDFDNLPLNAVVLIKLNVNDPLRYTMLQRAIQKQVLEPRIETLKEKRICILFLQSDDDISVMTEEDMNQAGWEKKEKNRIITL